MRNMYKYVHEKRNGRTEGGHEFENIEIVAKKISAHAVDTAPTSPRSRSRSPSHSLSFLTLVSSICGSLSRSGASTCSVVLCAAKLPSTSLPNISEIWQAAAVNCT